MNILIGSGRDLLPFELPTLRDVMRYGIFLREQSGEDVRNYPAVSLAKDIYPKILEKWGRANRSFVAPIINSQPRILKKIQESWEETKNISLGRGKLDVKEAFTPKLDKLFDILNCKCEMFVCSEFGCFGDAGCSKGAHINCTCPKEMKIPELAFIKGQREKTGSIGPHQIGPNLPEHNRQVKKRKRQEDERRRHTEYKQKRKYDTSKPTNELILSHDQTEEQLADVQDGNGGNYELTSGEPSMPSTSHQKAEYNTLEIRNVAMQSIRYGVGLRATAAITTAAFMDAGLITEVDKSLVVDHKRAQEKLMKSLNQEFEDLCQRGEIDCISFDGREDATKVMLKADNSDQQFPNTMKEQHYSACSEPGGRYLYHFKPVKGSKREKSAEVIANNLIDFMK